VRDVIFVLVVIAFFAVAAVFVRACDALVASGEGELER